MRLWRCHPHPCDMQPWWNLHSFWSSNRRHWPRVLGVYWTQKGLRIGRIPSRVTKKTGGEMSRLVVMNHGHNHDFYASWSMNFGFPARNKIDMTLFTTFFYYRSEDHLAQLLRILWGRPGLLRWKFGVRDHQGDGLGTWERDGRWVAGVTSHHPISYHIASPLTLIGELGPKTHMPKSKDFNSFEPLRVAVGVYWAPLIWLQHSAAPKMTQKLPDVLCTDQCFCLRTTFEILIRYFAFRLSAAVIAEAWSMEWGAVDGDKELRKFDCWLFGYTLGMLANSVYGLESN